MSIRSSDGSSLGPDCCGCHQGTRFLLFFFTPLPSVVLAFILMVMVYIDAVLPVSQSNGQGERRWYLYYKDKQPQIKNSAYFSWTQLLVQAQLRYLLISKDPNYVYKRKHAPLKNSIYQFPLQLKKIGAKVITYRESK